MNYKNYVVVIPQEFKDAFEKAFQDEFVKEDGKVETTWQDLKVFFYEWLQTENYLKEEEEISDGDTGDFTGAGDRLGYANDR